MRVGPYVVAMAFLISVPEYGAAQFLTKYVCWAEMVGSCYQLQDPGSPYNDTPNVRHYTCGSGGHSGFNPGYVCQDICGAPVGPRCRITPGPVANSGRCGILGAKVECF